MCEYNIEKLFFKSSDVLNYFSIKTKISIQNKSNYKNNLNILESFYNQ